MVGRGVIQRAVSNAPWHVSVLGIVLIGATILGFLLYQREKKRADSCCKSLKQPPACDKCWKDPWVLVIIGVLLALLVFVRSNPMKTE